MADADEPGSEPLATLREGEVLVLDQARQPLGIGRRAGVDTYGSPIVDVPAELFEQAVFALDDTGPIRGPIFKSPTAERRCCSTCGKDLKPQAITCGACGTSTLGTRVAVGEPDWRVALAEQGGHPRIRYHMQFRRNGDNPIATFATIAAFLVFLVALVVSIPPAVVLAVGVGAVVAAALVAGFRGWGAAAIVVGGVLVASSFVPFLTQLRAPHLSEPVKPPAAYGFKLDTRISTRTQRIYRAVTGPSTPNDGEAAVAAVLAYYEKAMRGEGWAVWVRNPGSLVFRHGNESEYIGVSVSLGAPTGYADHADHVLILSVADTACGNHACGPIYVP